jgi:4-hydroxy-tetrahydrodipicolinate synthase
MTYFTGCITALITPFKGKKNNQVNFEKLDELVKGQAESGTSAVVPCGTTGESPTLSHDEHDEVVSCVVKAAKKYGIKVLAGTGSNSTEEAVRLTSRAKELGADAALVVTPYYNKPTPEGLLLHYKEIDALGLPVYLYNIPGRTGINIDPETIITLAASCNTIVGVKASNGDLEQITETALLSKTLNKKFCILSGDDSLTLPILSVGGVGIVSVIANFCPSVMVRLVEVYANKEIHLAKAIMHAIFPLSRALLKFGSNPSPIKALMDHSGMDVGGCRLPLAGIQDEKVQILWKLADEMKEELKKVDEGYQYKFFT